MEMRILLLFFACFVVIGIDAWRGNVVAYRRWRFRYCNRCICRYWWGCSWWRRYRCTYWYTDWRCKPGWTHRGDYNCNIPVCAYSCNNGRCIAPNECRCPSTTTGLYCGTRVCSYESPCYPGTCYGSNSCNCTTGFLNHYSYKSRCMRLDDRLNQTFIGRSTATISHYRETDQSLLYYFQIDGTDDDPATRVVWSNQQIFNRLSFEFETKYEEPEELPERPIYVTDTELGIVHGSVKLEVTDFQGLTMARSRYTQTCLGASANSPATDFFNCTIPNFDFKTLIEDADTLKVTFIAKSGGFRRMVNLDRQSRLPTEYFTPAEATKVIEFKFDFIPPKFCNENGSTIPCPVGATVLSIDKEFTKDPIQLRWSGWTDTRYGSGVRYFYVELHHLVVKDATEVLTEEGPLDPAYTATVLTENRKSEYTHTITPEEPGMYSALLEVRDVANNSRLARRFVLYDPISTIEFDTTRGNGLYVSSAAKETGYLWQAKTDAFNVNWEGYFVNKLHEDNRYLNEIDEFPVQFKDIVDDKLNVHKFVDPKLDDNEGARTKNKITNLRGIVKFEYAVVYDTSTTEPTSGWTNVLPLRDKISIRKSLDNGQRITIWVRAHDKMGNTKAANTTVTLDSTPPVIVPNSKTFVINDNSTEESYDSSILLEAYDPESGVHEVELKIVMVTSGKEQVKKVDSKMAANFEKRDVNAIQNCEPSKDEKKCFHRKQKIQLNHCLMMLPDKEHLAVTNATITVFVRNQAMQEVSTTVTIDRLSKLSGLETYSGPENVRIENAKDDSFRIAWDPPKKMSCYGRADIYIRIQYTEQGKDIKREHTVPATSTFFDVGNLPHSTHFIVSFATQVDETSHTSLENFQAQTGEPPEEKNNSAVIAGVAVAGYPPLQTFELKRVIALVVVIVILFAFAVRRGYIKPREKLGSVRRAATRVYRERVRSGGYERTRPKQTKAAYDNRQSELYIYGEMDLEGPQVWHLDRNDISLEKKIANGHFANIYKATMRRGRGSGDVVVAKTLKENHRQEDVLLMNAKINFFGTAVGEHQNVIKFIGAVVSDATFGPFMILEYCEKGTLKDYLVEHRNDMSIELQDNLYRFGLNIARGMEYLAKKSIVHRRLAARNVLLNFLNEVKITGFGPQPADEEVSDAEQGKKERIPIKWMAPECMSSTKDATEKSDVWSYAVVLWEIFTLGETPYPDIRGKDLPSRLKRGTRLPKPEQCDDTWHNVMTRCWAERPEKRPHFSDIRHELDNLFVAAPGEDYYYYQK